MAEDGWALPDATATRAAGAALAAALREQPGPRPALRIALHGELGAGKTTLVGGLLAALGHAGPVRSPTYTLIEPYELAGASVQHCDLYRLQGAEAVAELGLRELLVDEAVLLVEWPERAGELLEPWDLALTLAYDGEGRRLRLRAGTPRGEALRAALEPRLRP